MKNVIFLKSGLAVTLLTLAATPEARAADWLYVASDATHSVRRYDAVTGQSLGDFVAPNSGGLVGPRGVIFGPDGNLYVANQFSGTTTRGNILRYHGTNGTFLGTFIAGRGAGYSLQIPHGILWKGDRFYVADMGDPGVNIPGHLWRFRVSNGIASFDRELTVGALQSRFRPRGIVFGPDGHLYATSFEPTSGRVLKFDGTNGTYLGEFIPPDGRLVRPEAINFSPDGSQVLVNSFKPDPNNLADTDTDRILVYAAANGAFIKSINLPLISSWPASPIRPYAQAAVFGPGGKLTVAHTGNGLVRQYDLLTGNYEPFLESESIGAPWFLTYRRTDPATLQYQGSDLVIVSQPVTVETHVGGSARFSVTATSSRPITYQWRFNNALLGSATNGTLELTNVGAEQFGNYDVVVDDGISAFSSRTVSLARPVTAVHEPFDYAPGLLSFQNGGSGFAGPWSSDANLRVAAEPLVHPGLPTAGNSVRSYTRSYAYSQRPLATPIGAPGTTRYISCVLRPNSAPVAGPWFGLTLEGAGGPKLNFGKQGYEAPTQFAIEDYGGYNWVASPVPVVSGQTVLLVVKAEFTAGMDRFTLHVNPAPGSPEPGNGTVKFDSDVGMITALSFRCGGLFNADEIRIGDTFESVTPPYLGPPIIVGQPASQSVYYGQTVTLSAQIGGPGPMSYQWLHDGELVGTNNSLELPSVTAHAAGNYRLIVANSFGSATSAVATVEVRMEPHLVVEPGDQIVTAGDSASFTAVAEGAGPLTYQWYRTPFNPVGSDSPTLAMTGVQMWQSGFYQLVVSNPYGSATSQVAHLEVIVPGLDVYDGFVGLNAGYGWSADWEGSASVLYRATLVYSNLFTAGLAAQFVNGFGSLTRLLADGLGTPGTTKYLGFVIQPGGPRPGGTDWFGLLLYGSSGERLFVGKPGGGATGKYVIENAGGTGQFSSAVPYGFDQPALLVVKMQFAEGADRLTLYVNPVPGGPEPLTGVVKNDVDLGFISMVGLAGWSPFAIDEIRLGDSFAAVTPASTAPPVILAQPQGLTVPSGSDAVFSVAASGARPMSYQWMGNGAPVAAGTNTTLTVTNVGLDQAGDYWVVLSNAFGVATSQVATLQLLSPPVIVSSPASQTVVAGENVAFHVTATNSATLPIGFQLRKGSTIITTAVVNARSCVLTLFNVTTAATPTNGPGSYRIVATNAASPSGVSPGSFTLTVVPPSPPLVSTLEADHLTVDSARLNASVNARGATTWAWFEYGPTAAYGWGTVPVHLGNATNPVPVSVALHELAPGVAYHFRALATNSGGFVAGADLTVAIPEQILPPVIGGLSRLPEGAVQWQFSGTPRAAYSALVSSNLLDWTSSVPIVEIVPGWFQFTDPDPLAHPRRFFRIRSP